MKKYFFMLLVLAGVSFAQVTGFSGVASENLGLKAYINPSLLGYEPAVRFTFLNYSRDQYYQGSGFIAGMGKLAFSYYKADPGEFYLFASGSEVLRGYYTGSSIRWFSGSTLNPEYDLSLTLRPYKYFSLGVNVQNVFQSNSKIITTNAGLALRPFGDSRFTLEGDMSFGNDEIDSSFYSINASTEIIQGLNVKAGFSSKLNDSGYDPVYELGLALTLGNFTGGTRSVHDKDFENANYLSFAEVSNVSPQSLFKPKESKLIEIELEGEYREEVPKGFFINMLGGGNRKSTSELIGRIERLKKDKSVAGIILKSKNYSMSFAQREELRNVLKDFKDSGKRIYSYFVSASQSNYYLISVSDKIYMYPEGDLSLQGLGLELMFFKDIMDKLGVKMQAIRHGKFKSAVEPFIQNEASEENLEQLDTFLTRLDVLLKEAVTEGRKLTPDELETIMNTIPYHTGKSAVENKLVDELLIENDLVKTIKKQESARVRTLKGRQYFALKDQAVQWPSVLDKQIAVVYATGSIVTGKSSGGGFISSNKMGSETTAGMIRRAREDKNVKAIVLRVDSGGGSGLASDLILTELRLAQEEDKKPVIVSMGSAAASGGYWISAYADKIFADRSTLTGSIGVFALMPSIEGLSGKIGINTQRIRKNKFAVQSIFNDLDEDETAFLQQHIDGFYKGFVEKVAEARGKTYDEIDKIAEGRVWAGEDALELGLIDEIGGLKEAVEYAAGIAEIDRSGGDYIKVISKYSDLSFTELVFSVAAEKLDMRLLEQIRENEIFNLLDSDDMIMMMMPYRVEIK
ncbi:MAG: signal peptide peptidase SppA [Candidatus Delongbacteria bacterium]